MLANGNMKSKGIRMKWLFLISLLSIEVKSDSFFEVDDHFEQFVSTDKFKSNAALYLKSFPRELSYEERRWLIPPVDPYEFEKLFLKGKFLLIKEPEKGLRRHYEVSIKDNKGNWEYQYSFIPGSAIYKGNSQICEYDARFKTESRPSVFRCRSLGCKQIGPYTIHENPMDYVFVKSGTQVVCDIQPFWGPYHSREALTYITFDFIDSRKSEITKNLSSQIFKIDLDICLKSPASCEVKDLPYSKFEKAWINMKIVQMEKSDRFLNGLISNLLPCVIKKDKRCISRYLTTQAQINDVGDPEYHKVIELSDENLKEMEACLKYESILPFGGRLRGIKKMCFMGHELIQAIDYPEAGANGDSYYVPTGP